MTERQGVRTRGAARWICPVLLFSVTPGALAASEVAAESVRYVVAEAGLRLRAQPGIETESLAVVPFGAEVRVVGPAATEEGLVVENIPGHWVRVSSRASADSPSAAT